MNSDTTVQGKMALKHWAVLLIRSFVVADVNSDTTVRCKIPLDSRRGCEYIVSRSLR